MGAAGRLLRGVRAGNRHSVWAQPELQAPETIVLRSSAFASGAPIPPARHRGVGAGENVSPPLSWTGVPDQTAQLLLVIEDTDVPLPRPIIHTIALIDPELSSLDEGRLSVTSAGVQFGQASFGRRGYHGPRPMADHGTHHYGFYLFALDSPIHGEDAKSLVADAAGRVIARGALIGTDQR